MQAGDEPVDMGGSSSRPRPVSLGWPYDTELATRATCYSS